MTEIDVVKKPSRAWLWILIAILVVAALFFLMRDRGDARAAANLIDGAHQPTAAVALLMQG